MSLWRRAMAMAREEVAMADAMVLPEIVEHKVWSEYEQLDVTQFGDAEPRYIDGPPTADAHVVRIERDIIWPTSA